VHKASPDGTPKQSSMNIASVYRYLKTELNYGYQTDDHVCMHTCRWMCVWSTI